MRILQVNQYYYPRGGADKYFLDLGQALTNAGEEVAFFAMQHPKNLATPWSKYFVSRVSFNEPGLIDKLKTPGRVLYSRETKNKFTKLIKDFQPDIIHIHNIYHHLSPSLLDVAAKFKVPVIMHLHDYKLICPNHALFTKGSYCERCLGGKYYHCLTNKCIKNSWPASALAMIEMYWHHNILKIYERRIAKFIAPSQFMRDTVIRFGQEANKIITIYNPLPSETPQADEYLPSNNDRYFLYFGRLSEEKGISTLIEAAALSGCRVKIAGDGPEKLKLQALAKSLKAPIEFLGFQSGQKLNTLVSQSTAIIIPSIWVENMPLSLLEALAIGKPAIVSEMGGLPEMIKEGQNGWLFKSGEASELAQKMKIAESLKTSDYQKMSEAAQRGVAALNYEEHLKKIRTLYQENTK